MGLEIKVERAAHNNYMQWAATFTCEFIDREKIKSFKIRKKK